MHAELNVPINVDLKFNFKQIYKAIYLIEFTLGINYVIRNTPTSSIQSTFFKKYTVNKLTGPPSVCVIFYISELECKVIYQNATTDAAPLELTPFNPKGLYETEANILSYLSNRSGD